MLSITQWTMSFCSPKEEGSIALFPVTSSSRTTPKLYTSLFSFTFKVYAYSAKNQNKSN